MFIDTKEYKIQNKIFILFYLQYQTKIIRKIVLQFYVNKNWRNLDSVIPVQKIKNAF